MVVIVGAVGRLIVIDNSIVSVCCGFPESRTRKVGDEVPVVADIPLITPDELSCRPAGNEPFVMSQVFVPVPPEEPNVKL